MAKKKRLAPDKFTNPNDYGSASAEMIHAALSSLDRTARECEERWGVGRLVELADPGTAARFGSAKAKLDVAIRDNDVEEIVHRASVMERGWKALDIEARKAGHKFVDPQAWIWEDDEGHKYAFLKDNAEALAYVDKHPGVRTFTMDEIIRVAAMFKERTKNMGVEVKDYFPGANVINVTRKDRDDEIPF